MFVTRAYHERYVDQAVRKLATLQTENYQLGNELERCRLELKRVKQDLDELLVKSEIPTDYAAMKVQVANNILGERYWRQQFNQLQDRLHRSFDVGSATRFNDEPILFYTAYPAAYDGPDLSKKRGD